MRTAGRLLVRTRGQLRSARRRINAQLWRFGGEGASGGWRARHVALLALLSVTALLTLVLLRGWSLAGQIPAWWTLAGALDDAVAGVRAEGVERGVTAALYSTRDDERPWAVEVRSEDANAWLRERLPRWLANRGVRWPKGVSTPRIRFGDGAITLGVSLHPPIASTDRVVGVSFQPRVAEDGALRAYNARALVGRATLPGAGGAGGRWTSWLPEEWVSGEAGQWLLGALGGEQPLIEHAAFALDDGRSIRLLEVRLEEGRMSLTCVTERTRR